MSIFTAAKMYWQLFRQTIRPVVWNRSREYVSFKEAVVAVTTTVT